MQSRKLKRLGLVSAVVGALLLIALVVLFVITRPLPGADLPFATVDADEAGEVGHLYVQTEPKFVIITQPDQASSLGDEVWRRAQQSLRELDYGRFFAVAVFQGRQTETGYRVEVQRVSQDDRLIVIEALFHRPLPGTEMALLETSPYQIISVGRPRNTGRDFQFVLKEAGRTIITQTHYLP